MLFTGIAGGAICQNNKAKYDTSRVLEGIRPPILLTDFGKRSDSFYQEDVKKNTNKITIDFGNKNRLLIDYQGKEFILNHDVDSLLQNFWNDYQLVKESFKKDLPKKVTYFGKNKNVNQKPLIDVVYYTQKEVLQIQKSQEVALVRLLQDTLILVNYEEKAAIELVKSHNRVFKTYPHQTFTFTLNSLDNIEEIMDTNINQAIIEAVERAKNERKSTYPWKVVKVENDLMNQKIKSSISQNPLLDLLELHGDIGLGTYRNTFAPSLTIGVSLVSSKYLNKGFVAGAQLVFPTSHSSITNTFNTATKTMPFAGMTFFKTKEQAKVLKGGVFVGYTEKSVKLFGWYQLHPLVRIQPEINLFGKFPPVGLRIAFGI